MLKIPLLFIDPDGLVCRMRTTRATPESESGYALTRIMCSHLRRECSTRCAALFVDIDHEIGAVYLACCHGGSRRIGLIDGERVDHDWIDEMTWGSAVVESGAKNVG